MFKSLSSLGAAIGVVFATLFSASAAVAETLPVKGQPIPGQMGLQNAATEMHSQITAMFNWGLTIPMTIIALFVTILLVWVMIRYNAKANPNPSSVTHNTMLEVVWIAIPTVIVLVLLVFAWRLIFFIDAQPQRPGLVITAVGKQWRWGYEYDRYMPSADYAQVQAALDMGDAYDGDITAVGEYVDLAGLTYDSCSKQVCGASTDVIELGEGLDLAEVDNHMVIPSGTDVAFQIAADDVGHSFAMPSFGIKIDAWPGRTNYTWTHVEPGQEGVYIGQCSEICGYGHAYMPIIIEVVTPAQFDAWVEAAHEQAISSNGLEIPRVTDVLGDQYWANQTAMVSQ